MQIGSVHWRQRLNCMPSGDTLTSHLKAALKCFSLSAYVQILFGYIWRYKMCQVLCFHTESFYASSSPTDSLVILSSHGWVFARNKHNTTAIGGCSLSPITKQPLYCRLGVFCASSVCNILKNKPVLLLRNSEYGNYVFGTQRPVSSAAVIESSAHGSGTANHTCICIMSSGASVCSWINLWMAQCRSVMDRRADYTGQMMQV